MVKIPAKAPRYGGNFVVNDWMVRSLKLFGSELIIYAIIQSFSQDGKGKYYGSIQYLTFWTGLGKTSIIKKLKILIEKKLIVKKIIPCSMNSNRHYCEYWTVFSRLNDEEKKKIIIQ